MNESTRVLTASSYEAELVNYRSICPLAVLTLVLGLFSFLAVASPGAWLIPFVGTVCGTLAIVRIRRNPETLTGMRVALLGLFLSLFFGAFAPARFYSNQYVVQQQASDFAETWLHLLTQRDLNPAHQATMQYYFRRPAGTILEEYYAQDERERKDRDEYFGRGVALDIVNAGEDAIVELQKVDVVYYADKKWHTTLQYAITPKGGQPILTHIRLERITEGENVYWWVTGLLDSHAADDH
ncbi:MAG: DUF4190 domain-containing protein [Pirellulaceae bacterium]